LGLEKHITLLIVTFLSLLNVKGQYKQYFQNVTTDNGLSYEAVSTINQDDQGFLWVGTKDGLNRFDGVNFKTYTNQNSALIGNGISKIFLDYTQQLWIGSYNGLYKYDPNLDKLNLISVDGNNSIGANLQVNDIVQTTDSSIWVATEDGLYHMAGQHLIKVDLPELGNISLKSLEIAEEKHILYLGSGYEGVWQFNVRSGKLLIPPYLNILADNKPLHIRQVYLHEGLLYICTWGNGIFIADKKNNSWRQLSVAGMSLTDKIVYTMEIIGNSVWIGLSDALIKLSYPSLRLENIFKSSSTFEYALSGTGVNCIFLDRDENLWFGTTDNGLSILGKTSTGMEYYFYSDQNNFQSENEYELIGSGTKLHLNWNAPKNRKFSKISSAYPNLLDQTEELIVLGSFRNGFAIFNKSDSSVLINTADQKNRRLSHDHVSDALIDGSKVYLTTWGGGVNIYDLETKSFEIFDYDGSISSSLSDNDATAIVKQNDSIFWISTFGGGVNRFNAITGTFKSFKSAPFNKSTVSSNDVLDLFIDTKNLLWLGYWGAGIDYIDLKKIAVTRFSKSRKLPSSIVTSIEEDSQGDMWFSTKRGICKFDRNRNKVSIYNNGFSAASNAYQIGRSALDESGDLYFGGDKGYFKISNEYRSADLILNHNVVYTGFDILGDTIDASNFLNHINDYDSLRMNEAISLAHDQNSFSFHFSLSIFPLEDRYYEARLKGFDSSWREIGKSPSVTFTNLNSGTYWLQIRCHTGDWETYHTSKVVKIKIALPWWTTWWAFTIYTMTFVALLYSFFIYTSRWSRIRAKLKTEKILRSKDNELNELKERFFVNISHEIRTPLTLIINSIDTLSNKILMNKVSQNSFYSIKKNANHLLQLVNEVLDFKKIDDDKQLLHLIEDDFVLFCKEIYLSFKDMAERKDILFELESLAESAPFYFDRMQMEKVLYNLLSNAIKFTPNKGSIKVLIKFDQEDLHLIVSNSGKGIDLADQKIIFEPFNQGKTPPGLQKNRGFGLGLYITKNIINQHEGVITVESGDHQTVFHIKLPINTHHQPEKGEKVEENIEAYLTDDPAIADNNDFKEFSYKTILVVEDNHELSSYLVAVFQDSYQVLVAENGAVGLEIARNKVPDMIISDVMMPVMDGITMTKELKSDKRTSHIPVIILTARTSLIYKHEGYDTGADDYIVKPFSKSLLIIRVRNLLKNRMLVAERIQKDVITGTKDLALNSKDEEFLNELMKVVEENATKEDLSATLIAQELGMSHSVIYKKIKFLTGMSLIEFIRDYKLKTAAKLIAELGYSVADASFQVGFADTKYFSRMFKKRFGVNPSKYDGSTIIRD